MHHFLFLAQQDNNIGSQISNKISSMFVEDTIKSPTNAGDYRPNKYTPTASTYHGAPSAVNETYAVFI